MIPMWKSPIKLPVELPVGPAEAWTSKSQGQAWSCPWMLQSGPADKMQFCT